MSKRGGEDKNVLISTLPEIPGYEVVSAKGFVTGSSVEFVPPERVIYATIATIWDKEAQKRLYETIFRRARHRALSRLVDNAKALGANAVLNVHVRIWRAGYGIYEAYAYGTAVEVKKQ